MPDRAAPSPPPGGGPSIVIMADPLISLDTEHAFVQPGGQVRVTITLTNTGTLVEGYWLQVLGPAAAWAEVVPPELSVYPQQDATAAVIFSPPSDGSATSGLLPFGVLASSSLDVDSSASAEGDLEIGELHQLQAKIIPVTSTGRWRGRHVIQLSNWGNTGAQLQLVASNPDEALGFYVSPDFVDLPPGGHATVRLSARAKHPFLRGSPVRIPFQVVGEPWGAEQQAAPATPYADPSRPVIDAALNQKPILSRALITVLAVLLLASTALVTYLLTRPDPPPFELAPRGSPPKPSLRVVAVTPDSVTLAWDKVELADKYTLQQIDPATQNPIKADPLDAALTQASILQLTPASDVCFRLSVTRSGVTGPLSDLVCTKTAEAPPSPEPTPTPSVAEPTTEPPASETPSPSPPTPTPSFSPGDPVTDPIMKQQWITVATILPKTVAEDDVRLHVQQLAAAGVDAKYLDSQFYPRMVIFTQTPAPAPSPTPTDPAEQPWVVFVGPFSSQAEADLQCPAITAAQGGPFCVTAQPDPPQ